MEPWMRGYLVGVDPALAAVLYGLQQLREDVAKWTEELSDEEVWWSEGDIAPVGFQIRHIAGSIDRLITYADGRALSDEQLAVLSTEKEHNLTRAQLLELLERAIVKAEALVRTTTPGEFGARRLIGRKEIPTTLIGLLVHTVEHSQRHLGAMIVTAKLVRLRRAEVS